MKLSPASLSRIKRRSSILPCSFASPLNFRSTTTSLPSTEIRPDRLSASATSSWIAFPSLKIASSSGDGGIEQVSDIWKPRALYITENGCSADDVVTSDGRVEDTDRVMYLRNHLSQLHRAASEGYPIKGYFLWSLMDNYEWADGYSKRFGIHYVDFKLRRARRS